MSSLHVIGDADTVLAFALGGIPGEVAETAAEVGAAVDAAVGALQAHGGPLRAPMLLLITRTAAEQIRAQLERIVIDPRAPLVVEIPGANDAPGRMPLPPSLGVRV